MFEFCYKYESFQSKMDFNMRCLFRNMWNINACWYRLIVINIQIIALTDTLVLILQLGFCRSTFFRMWNLYARSSCEWRLYSQIFVLLDHCEWPHFPKLHQFCYILWQQLFTEVEASAVDIHRAAKHNCCLLTPRWIIVVSISI